jgi:hypothetical protein
VSGGVTGTRESLLKSDGAIVEFPSLESAEAEAVRLNVTMNHHHSTADFSYKAVPCE